MFKVYVAGPYTKGDSAVHVRNAIDAANSLAQLGFAPFVPHLVHFWHMIHPHSYDFWTKLDNEFVVICDGMLVLPGESAGTEAEVKLAEERGIPVFNSIQELLDFRVDQARSSTSHYVNIVINGIKHRMAPKEMSYAEVVLLAFGQFTSMVPYTVTVDDGDRGRMMSFGDSIFIENGMVFSAALTNKA